MKLPEYYVVTSVEHAQRLFPKDSINLQAACAEMLGYGVGAILVALKKGKNVEYSIYQIVNEKDFKPAPMPTFEEAWANKEEAGYKYGEDALEQVHFGWDIALKALAKRNGQS